MARPARAQIIRERRKDGSVTFRLRVRIGGADESVPLGNSQEGWDEVRVEAARKQLLAKIELGLWTPRAPGRKLRDRTQEPTFRELATDWLHARGLNPAIRERTLELNESQLTRYLLPFFGELRPSQITPETIRAYRERIHSENAAIQKAGAAGKPLRDPGSARRLRTLSNESINKTLQLLATILDDAEDQGWVDRNVARGRRVREPRERRRQRGALDVDEFLVMMDAASELDQQHSPQTLRRAERVRALRDGEGLEWTAIAAQLGVSRATAFYLYGCERDEPGATCGPRRAIIATLGLAGPRVGELCALDNQDVSLSKARFYITDAKTEAGVRAVDIHPRLLAELTAYRDARPEAPMGAPAFPTRTGRRRDRNNVLSRVVAPVVARANELRAETGEPPLRTHVTPHTFRRTYITFMVAAGYDLPYIQAKVGHVDPSTTLAIYAQLMTRRDRDDLRSEIRDLFGQPSSRQTAGPASDHPAVSRGQTSQLRPLQKAGKGRTLHP